MKVAVGPALTTPPSSPKILTHVRQGKIASIYCDKPAKILKIETQDATAIRDERDRVEEEVTAAVWLRRSGP